MAKDISNCFDDNPAEMNFKRNDAEVHSPFKLQLIIHGAENLPIADWTTSDPYVEISIGVRNEGRTKTIYRNRSPTWEEIFNLKILHRSSMVSLKIFDEDKGKDDDLMGTVTIDLAEISLDQLVQSKYSVSPVGNFNTKASKLKVSVLITSNDAVIKVVPDGAESPGAEVQVGDLSPLSPTSSSLGVSCIREVVEDIVADCPQLVASESVVNALTRFITQDKASFIPEDLLWDLLWDAASLTKTSAEAASLIEASHHYIFNRTHLRLQNSSKIMMGTKSCHWHPPIPKHSIQVNLCANDSKFIALEFPNRLAMWVCARWLFLLYDCWKGETKVADLPSWFYGTYAAQCTLNVSDGRVISGRMTLSMERPFEVRINEEHLSLKSIHSLILASDSLLPKTYVLDVEILAFSATGEYSKEDLALMTHDTTTAATSAAAGAVGKKGIFQNVRMNIRSSIAQGLAKGVGHAVGATTNTHSTQDSKASSSSAYVVAKFDNVSQRAHKTQHVYLDCCEDSFSTRQLHRLRRSSYNLPQTVEESSEEPVHGAFPAVDRSSSGVSLLLCQGHYSAQQTVLGHKRLTVGMLHQKAGTVYKVPLSTQLGFGITVINSRNLQLGSSTKGTLGGAKGMHIKMKFTDQHGNSSTLGRLQEVKTNSITPTQNPVWNCSAVFKAQDGFENAAFLRIEVRLGEFASYDIVGTCFIPLSLFRSKPMEYTFPMTRHKNTAVLPCDAHIAHSLGETTFRIHRVEEEEKEGGNGHLPASVAVRAALLESNLFNTRWFSECLPAGAVGSAEHLQGVEEFSVMATQEGLEMVSVGEGAGVGSTATPHQPSPPSWRNDVLHHTPNALIAVCKERSSPHSSVLVPWGQVKDVCLISPSVLSLVVQVHRYMQDKHDRHDKHAGANTGLFRPADVEVFVSNCPAAELQGMIAERRWFDPFKSKIRSLVASGTTSGLKEEREGDDESDSAKEVVPDTEELSLGSALVAELDKESIALEARVCQIDRLIGQHNSTVDKEAEQEKSVILRRDCRLRAYMAALFGAGLQGDHHFEEAEIKAIMARDINICQNIEQKTEVATANNRIEFYLDTAEKRIRDAVLCGWNYREDRRLERCVEIFANGYFIEIVGLLGTFFEESAGNNSAAVAVKGLGNKVDLIKTYLEHADRLAIILDHALRPYALKAEPTATLSLFLDFDILVSWYTSVLLLEMRGRVDSVLAVWQDRSKDVTDRAHLYQHPVPWVPQQVERANDRTFFTNIPEDLKKTLRTYLQYARIHRKNVAPSFQHSVGRLDKEVLMAYTSSFLYLSEEIAKQLDNIGRGRDWTASTTTEEELTEFATWFSSVANDAHRVEAYQLYSPDHMDKHKHGESDEEDDDEEDEDARDEEVEKLDFLAVSQEDGLTRKVEAVESRTVKAFQNNCWAALDHLSCIVFTCVFHERTDLLSDNLYKLWLDTLPKDDASVQGESEISIFSSIMKDVTFYLLDKQSFLGSACFCNLVSLCADKMLVLYLSLLKIAHRYGGAFGARECKQIRADIEAIRSGLEAALEGGGGGDLVPVRANLSFTSAISKARVLVKRKFVPLDCCCDLLRDELGSAPFLGTMKALQQISEQHPADAAAVASMIETCLGLKGVSKYCNRNGTLKKGALRNSGSASAPPSPVPAANPSVTRVISGENGNSAAPTAPAGPTPPAKRRGSMFSFFAGQHHTSAPSTPPVPAPALHAADHATITAPAHSTHGTASDSSMTAAVAGQEDDEDVDDNAAELLSAEQIRDQSMVECVALMIQTIRDFPVPDHKKQQQKHTVLAKSSPLQRVFGSGLVSEYPLHVQVLHSANPTATACSAAGMVPTGTGNSNNNSSGYFSAFTGMLGFGKPQSSQGQGQEQVHHTTSSLHHHQHDDGSDVDLGQQLSITGLKVEDLFYLDSLRSPHPYLKIQLGSFAFATKVHKADTSADWSAEGPILVPLSDLAISSSRSSMAELQITLCYKGLFADHVIGTVVIPFAPYAPPLFLHKRFTVADFQSPQASKAAQRAQVEGRSHPSIILSVAPIAAAVAAAAAVPVSPGSVSSNA